MPVKKLAVFICMIICSLRLAGYELSNDPDSIDALLRHDSFIHWQRAALFLTEFAGRDYHSGIQLMKNTEGIYNQTGTITSPRIDTGFLLREILPSWNIELPPETGFSVQIRVYTPDERVSEWYYLVSANPPSEVPFEKIRADEVGKCDIDFWAGQPVRYVQYRVWLYSHSQSDTPRIRRFFLALSGQRQDNPEYRVETLPQKPIPASGNTPAPIRFQSEISDPALVGRICCPVSVAMVLNAFDIEVSIDETSERVYDSEYRIFGIWPHASQAISEYGLVSYVDRFRSPEQARRALAEGKILMISMLAQPGELPEAHYNSIDGHIIVVTGYEGEEWFIVNDPSSRNPELVHQVKYSAEGLKKVWLDRGGVAMVTARKEALQ